MNRARAIERSIWCCVLGAVSLLPLLGLPAALVAFGFYHSVRRTLAGRWNPAEQPLVVGFILAWIGVVISLVAVTFGAFALWAVIDSQPQW
jgi:hypothetical protein